MERQARELTYGVARRADDRPVGGGGLENQRLVGGGGGGDGCGVVGVERARRGLVEAVGGGVLSVGGLVVHTSWLFTAPSRELQRCPTCRAASHPRELGFMSAADPGFAMLSTGAEPVAAHGGFCASCSSCCCALPCRVCDRSEVLWQQARDESHRLELLEADMESVERATLRAKLMAPDVDSVAAATILLLRCASEGARFRALHAGELTVAQQDWPHDGFFRRHTILLLPRGAPVHHFAVSPVVAQRMNAELVVEALRQLDVGSSVRVSNVDGFHSLQEVFRAPPLAIDAAPGDASLPPMATAGVWYAMVRAIVLEALRTITSRRGSDFVAHVPFDEVELTGWLNVSHCAAFNLLHDHGNALWSAVYFVDSGTDDMSTVVAPSATAPATSPATAPATAPASCHGGALLLLEEDQELDECTYLPISPRAGDLWLFPGHLPHAVLPRLGACRDCARRISVACNVHDGNLLETVATSSAEDSSPSADPMDIHQARATSTKVLQELLQGCEL